jgi:acetyl esterase/lipase
LNNKAIYGFNDRVIIMGDSAGGNLAYHTAAKNLDEIDALILVSPVFDPTMSTPSYTEQALNIWLPARAMALYWAEYQQNATVVISPLDIPTLLIISDDDVLRDEDITYAANDLENVQGVLYDGMVHDFFITGLDIPSVTDFTQRVSKFITHHTRNCGDE